MTEFISHRPHPPQAAFLLLDDSEVLFGGAAGGGKSDALLMAALQWVDVPGYAALLLRRKHVDLVRADALIPRSHEWLSRTDAHWNGDKKMWTFPSGATLEFGHCESENDKYNYQGSAWQFVGFDELTHFTESMYQYIGLSRRRRLEKSIIPLRTRGSANPGGLGHQWVKTRFVDPKTRRARFVPSKLEDNPSLDRASYEEGLKELSGVEQKQLRNGDWDVQPNGTLFHREWFEIIEASEIPRRARRFRHWDLAATEPKKGKKDPDFTAGLGLAEYEGVFYVYDVKRDRLKPAGVEALVEATAKEDGREVAVSMEQEPGSSGVNTIDNYSRKVLRGYAFTGVRSTGDKVTRAMPVSAAAENGNVKIVRASWTAEFINELVAFPHGANDDQVDGLSGAHRSATEAPEVVVTEMETSEGLHGEEL